MRITPKSDYILLSYIDDSVAPIVTGAKIITWDDYWGFIHQLINYLELKQRVFMVQDITDTYNRNIRSLREFLELIRVTCLSQHDAYVLTRTLPYGLIESVDITDWLDWSDPDNDHYNRVFN
jgi:hypothetical protein